MALEDLTQKIITDAQVTADRVRKAAQEHASTLTRESAERMRIEREAFRRESDQLVHKQELLSRARTGQEARSVVERAQRALLDQTFVRALDTIKGADDVAYTALLQPALKQIKESKDEITSVYAPADRVALMERAVRDAGIAVSVEPRPSIQGGFVAVGATSEYDARFEQMIVQIKRTHEPTIARMLFAA